MPGCKKYLAKAGRVNRHIALYTGPYGLALFADAWLEGWLAEISAHVREAIVHYINTFTVL